MRDDSCLAEIADLEQLQKLQGNRFGMRRLVTATVPEPVERIDFMTLVQQMKKDLLGSVIFLSKD
ncbi:hypothetical protein RIB2604_00400120 [Aspergillus luchuensis]|uniref:Uncharacterized protein n=1 Tax=Aspergillus kawachii TaxID=1069201 RepID=A0A146EYK6_ASPKA|nr:hypothetical protein RIB2604_00400120 [Aspergillus luchuensis]